MSHGERHLPNYTIGLLALMLIALGFFLAFSKQLPWQKSYQVKAVFSNAQALRPNSPVRIAGVNVGKVKQIEQVKVSGRGQQAAVVTMEIQDAGRPIHTDATVRLRPRLFLEGNLFADLKPGTPFAPEADSGFTIPPENTSISVQFDQVLTALQADTRRDLQILVKELGDAFQKYGGAEGFREFYRTGGPAFRSSSQVNEALLGTEEHDLSNLVVNADRTFAALSRNEQALKDLITNFRTVTGSFASNQASLKEAIRNLGPALEVGTPALRNLSNGLPALRAFAREALPGVRSTGPALDAANPWVDQVRGLVSKPELRGLSRDLRFAIPDLALLTRRQLPFLEEARALSACFNDVIIPWSNKVVPDPIEGAVSPQTGDRVPIYKETGYGLTGIGGESRSGDGNGQYIRIGGSGGPNMVVTPPAAGRPTTAAITPFPIGGALPSLDASKKTHFVQKGETDPEFICENQELPDLRSNIGPPPQQQTIPTSATLARPPGELGELFGQRTDIMQQLLNAQALAGQGQQSRANSRERDATRRLNQFYRQNGDELFSLLAPLVGGKGNMQRLLAALGGVR